MKTTILSEPATIISALREFFVENNVTKFCADAPTIIGFRTKFEGADVVIQAEVEPSVPRLRLLTSLLGEVAVPLEQCALVANFLCTRSRFVSVVVPQETQQFALESTLVLGDGMCLHSQLVSFAEAHMAGVILLSPLLGRFSRAELDGEQLALRLSLLAAQGETPANNRTSMRRPPTHSRIQWPGRN